MVLKICRRTVAYGFAPSAAKRVEPQGLEQALIACRWCAEQPLVVEPPSVAEQALLAVRAQVVLLQMLSTSRLALSRSVSISSEFMNWRSPSGPVL
jgi:hypothetical protein